MMTNKIQPFLNYNYYKKSFKIIIRKVWTLLLLTNQSIFINSLKSFSQLIRTHIHQTLGTIILYKPMSPPFLTKPHFLFIKYIFLFSAYKGNGHFWHVLPCWVPSPVGREGSHRHSHHPSTNIWNIHHD